MRTQRISLNGDWLFRADAQDAGIAQRWHSQPLSADQWQSLTIPPFWEFHGVDGDQGVGWYRRTFELPRQHHRDQLGLCLAGIDGRASVWLNGQPLASESPAPQRFAARTHDRLRTAENTITVRVADRGCPGGILTSAWLDGARDIDALLQGTLARQSARPSPNWARDAVIYEAYLRSASAEGTFNGLQARLDDLQRMGASVIWLMPIHPIGEEARKGVLGSPYSIRDYFGINPEFGTFDDFKALLDATHQRGMRLIIDLVLNHTAWDCPLINQHPEWFAHGADGNIRTPFDDWSDVAQLDYSATDLTDYMVDMMTFWIRDVGIDGFRCDVAGLVPDQVWNQARPRLDLLKPVLMLAEDDQPHQHLRAFDLTYDWHTYQAMGRLQSGRLRPADIVTLFQNERYDFPRGSARLRFSSNHDLCAWNRPAAVRYGPQATFAAAALTFALPGVPLIYSGQEIGNTVPLPLFERVTPDWRHSQYCHPFAFYAALCRLRRERESLRSGTLEFLTISAESVVGIRRIAKDETTLVLINLAPETVDTPVPVTGRARTRTLLGITAPAAGRHRRNIILPPFGVWIGTTA